MSEQEEREESKGFKVTDRRSFTAEGERRADVDVSDEPETRREATTTPPATRADAPRDAPPRSQEPTGDMGFLDLLSLLATQASIGLGGPHPVTGEPHEDLETARAMISMIEVLQEKTKGNLTREETQALENVLYQLRMHFINRAQSKKS